MNQGSIVKVIRVNQGSTVKVIRVNQGSTVKGDQGKPMVNCYGH